MEKLIINFRVITIVFAVTIQAQAAVFKHPNETDTLLNKEFGNVRKARDVNVADLKIDGAKKKLLNKLTFKNSLHPTLSRENAVIVMGFSDSGKDVVTQLISGHGKNLVSIESSQRPSTFIIKNNVLKPKNYEWYPRPIKNAVKNNINVYYEFPEFILAGDNEDITTQDIVSRFFEIKVIQSTERLKFVYVLNNISIFQEEDKVKFVILRLLQSFDKFKDNIALVITNVNLNANDEQSAKKSVAEYLQMQLKAMKKANNFPKEYLEIALNFENEFLVSQNATIKNADHYPKIGILWNPTELGSLTKSREFKDSKKSLIKLVHDNIGYTKRSLNYSVNNLLPNSLSKVRDLIRTAKENNINHYFYVLYGEIKEHFASLNSKSNDIFELREKFKKAYDVCSKIIENSHKLKRPKDLVDLISLRAKDMNVDVSFEPIQLIHKYDELIKFLEIISESGYNETSNFMVSQMKKFDEIVTKFLVDFELGYDMLTNLFELDCDIIQLYRNGKINFKNDWFKHENPLYEAVQFMAKVKNDESILSKYENLKLMRNEILENKLKLVLDYMYSEPEFEPKKPTDRLIVRGNYIFFDQHIVSKMKLPNGKIEIMAREKFYINSNFTSEGTQILAVAPVWVLSGQGNHHINLTGSEDLTEQPIAEEDVAKPGKNGSPGGNFLGIWKELISNEKSLFVYSWGGKGGPGQEGRAGYNHFDYYNVNDSVVSDVREIIKSNPGHYCKPRFNAIFFDDIFNKVGTCTYHYKYLPGTEGKVGGAGGLPGSIGKFEIIALNDEPLNYHGRIVGGTAAVGDTRRSYGKPGRHGLSDIGISIYVSYNVKYSFFNSEKLSEIKYSNSERAGVSKRERKNLEPSNPVKPFDSVRTFNPSPSNIVNEFKLYAWKETIGLHKFFLRSFIGKINNDPKVNELIVNPLGLINEFVGLEEQFEFNRSGEHLEYYTSLRDRINNYSQHESFTSEEDRVVLSHLKVALASKICDINLRPYDDLIVNLDKELELAKNNIQLYNQKKSIEAVTDTFDKYSESFEDKINEANSYINGPVAKDLEDTYVEIDEQVKKLEEEVIALTYKTEKEAYELKSKQDELSNQLFWRILFGVVTVASSFLAFLGPLGIAVGAGVITVTKLLETIVIKDNSLSGIENIGNLPAAVNTTLDKISKAIGKRTTLVERQLEEAIERVKKIGSSPNTDETLKEIIVKIADTKTDINRISRQKIKLNPEAFVELEKKEKDLKTFLAQKKVKVLEIGKSLPDRDKTLLRKYVTTAENCVALADAGISSYKKYREDEKALEKLVAASKIKTNDIEKLMNFRQEITTVFLKAIHNIGDDLKTQKKKFAGKSQAFLDLGRWQVQKTIREIRSIVVEKTQGFKTQSNFIDTIKRLEEGMSTTIDLYDRIQKSQEEINLANFVRNINTQLFNPELTDIKDPLLREKVNHLKFITLSKIVKKRYDSVYSAFKQFVFPFATYFLDDYELNFTPYDPQDTNALTAHTKLLADQAVSGIERMENQRQNALAKIKKYDNYLVPNNFFHDPTDPRGSPFYVWEPDSLKHVLPNLMNGNNVTLDADVTRGISNLFAIKFSYIDIRFNLSNIALQKDFDDVYSRYIVYATHLGNSHYKCCNKFYSMSTKPQSMWFSTKKKPDGQYPARSDSAYQKLRGNDPILSPYATWIFRLEFNSNEEDYDRLKDFADEPMSLELIGQGQFVEPTVDRVCSDGKLDLFYRSIDH